MGKQKQYHQLSNQLTLTIFNQRNVLNNVLKPEENPLAFFVSIYIFLENSIILFLINEK